MDASRALGHNRRNKVSSFLVSSFMSFHTGGGRMAVTVVVVAVVAVPVVYLVYIVNKN